MVTLVTADILIRNLARGAIAWANEVTEYALLRGGAPPSITMQQVYAAAMPYVLFGLLMIGLILVYPEVATFLPRSVAS